MAPGRFIMAVNVTGSSEIPPGRRRRKGVGGSTTARGPERAPTLDYSLTAIDESRKPKLCRITSAHTAYTGCFWHKKNSRLHTSESAWLSREALSFSGQPVTEPARFIAGSFGSQRLLMTSVNILPTTVSSIGKLAGKPTDHFLPNFELKISWNFISRFFFVFLARSPMLLIDALSEGGIDRQVQVMHQGSMTSMR